MNSRLINRLLKSTGQKFFQLQKSLLPRAVASRFIVLFCIGLVLSLAFNIHAIAAPESGNRLSALMEQLSFPKKISIRVWETIGLFIAGIFFSIVLDRWFSNRAARSGNTPLAEQARQLKQLKIGYPEGMTNLEVLRERGLLEKQLRPYGLTVTWSSFLSASSLIEALSNGTIDFCGGGGTASIFSQAADHLFVRVAKEKYTDPKGQAILVLENSPIQTLADLKHKKIAFDLGSSSHYVLIKALAKVGLDLSDIEPIYLTQPEALPLFRRGEIDAWVNWVPYAATQTRSSYPGRSIIDLESIFGDNVSNEVPTLYYAIPELVRDYPDLLKVILEEVNEAGAWAKKQELEAAKRLAEQYEIEPSIVDNLEKRSIERAIIPIDDLTLNALQQQANTFRDLRLIPKRVNVKDGTYSLQTKQNWTY
ncbi:aliphatic sulfonate ABC transporter substrate-binding protein [Chroococcus sp. FPU101]|uniref:aliphatic sulfonate ABC transporter substrate-binding protein n=1 Tax=Chroococcus sp. FPU101 TaxID=1974212 RepID=UPI001A8F45B8|nr:aliphatic sulfonate ABC transporter substrate-binding protein [Chroococcus sp. FPU101]GFE67528.1 ABC-transporter substrate-binding protein [Chroococcus sp. FPU101]